jgi:hypothetical protein
LSIATRARSIALRFSASVIYCLALTEVPDRAKLLICHP